MRGEPFLRRERRSDGFSGEGGVIGEVVRGGGGGVGVLGVRQKEVADAEAELSRTGDGGSGECSEAWLVRLKRSQLEEGKEGEGVDVDREHVAGASALNSVEDEVCARGEGVGGGERVEKIVREYLRRSILSEKLGRDDSAIVAASLNELRVHQLIPEWTAEREMFIGWMCQCGVDEGEEGGVLDDRVRHLHALQHLLLRNTQTRLPRQRRSETSQVQLPGCTSYISNP